MKNKRKFGILSLLAGFILAGIGICLHAYTSSDQIGALIIVLGALALFVGFSIGAGVKREQYRAKAQ
ncbi:MAG: hypothetical protein Q8R29_02050 [bacterium]|nr:hypothetical protein [bacterium]